MYIAIIKETYGTFFLGENDELVNERKDARQFNSEKEASDYVLCMTKYEYSEYDTEEF